MSNVRNATIVFVHCAKQCYVWCFLLFAEHFPLENVRYAKMYLMRTFCWCVALQKCICNILCNKMLQMHLMQKCIFAYIFLWKMFSVHFPLENVQRTFSKGKCSANQNVRKRQNAVFFALQKTKAVRCKNAFLHQMHFGNASNAFLHQMHFGNASHFTL